MREIILKSLSQKDSELAAIALIYRLYAGGSVSYGRWNDYTGTVNGSNEIVLSPGQLPTRDADIVVTVEGIGYHTAVGDITYTVNRTTNKITFSNTRLNGLSYVVKIWR